MCGILGSVNRHFSLTALDLLRHRGPDDANITHELVGPHDVMLGHRRLSIIDLSPAGRQPMKTLDSNSTIVFNGEVYNHLELRAQGSDVAYRSHSDTESILNYLSRHSISSACRLNGIFALALLDKRNRKLFLARDPFGVKPLYYWSDHRTFLFSSELRPLLSLVEDEISTENLAKLLRLRYLPAPDTLFKNIRKVKPGHVVEVDLTNPELSPREYPFAALPPDERPMIRQEEAIAEYEDLAEKAIRRQLMSDVKLGILLSGGVDSALLASFAQKHCAYKMKAFTVGFLGREKEDEIAEAQVTADLVGLEHHYVRLGFRDFLNFLPRVTTIVEEPVATTSVIPMYYLASLASRHEKVVLSGQGADEALGGYRRYRFEFLRSHVPRWVFPPMQGAARCLRLRNDAILRVLDSAAEPDDVRRFESVYGVFSREQIRRLTGHEPNSTSLQIRYFFELLQCARYPESVQRMMAIDLRMNLADDLLLYTDKISMHHSLECRVPFLDLELVRFIESLPTRYRVGFLRGKIVHKLVADRLLPDTITRRKKKGFKSPTNQWFRQTRLLKEILLDPTSRLASYCNLDEVEKILVEHVAGMDRERHIFLLLALHYWLAEVTRPTFRVHCPIAAVN